VLSFLLHRMKQLGMHEAAKPVLQNLDNLFPVVDSVVKYLESLRTLSEKRRNTVGKSVLTTARKQTTGSYERSCLLSLFTHNQEFDNGTAFELLYEQFPEPTTRRELMLALGHAHKEHWFQARRREVSQLEPWSRRAFIAGFSCVPVDQRSLFYRSLRSGADVLEQAVIKWAAANPF
jgi:hypothetical protein